MTNEEFKKQCPVLCKTMDLYPSYTAAMLVQAEFFKTHTYIFDVLSSRDAQILKLRYGIENGEMLCLQKIGDMLGLSHERVRQLEQRAYSTMRKPRCMTWLRDYNDNTFDRSLLNTLEVNYNSLIKRDIVRFLAERDLEVLNDIPVEQLNIKYSKTEETNQNLIKTLKEAGFNTCADIVEYMGEHTNMLEVGVSYPAHTAIVLAMSELIEKGQIKITSAENEQEYNALIVKKQKHQQAIRPEKGLKQANNREYLRRKKEQTLVKEVIFAGNIERAKTEPESVMLEELGFTLRTYNRLKQKGLNTVKDVIDFYINNNGNLQVIRHLGPALEKEVIETFNKLDICLIQSTPSHQQFLEIVRQNPEKVLIENLHFSKRVYSYLRHQGIYNVKALMETPIDVTNVKNLGRRSQQEIMYKMQELGIDCGVNIIKNK